MERSEEVTDNSLTMASEETTLSTPPLPQAIHDAVMEKDSAARQRLIDHLCHATLAATYVPARLYKYIFRSLPNPSLNAPVSEQKLNKDPKNCSLSYRKYSASLTFAKLSDKELGAIRGLYDLQDLTPELPDNYIEEVEKRAKNGSSIAQYTLGLISMQRDNSKAVEWFLASAHQGYPASQYFLGTIFAHGKGVPQDDEEAVKWYTVAAKQGNADAQNNLGYMYIKGRGVEQNELMAVTWFTEAARQGDADALYNLGHLYFQGRSLPKDMEKAAKYFLEAAKQGIPEAQNALGYMYNHGYGVRYNINAAIHWYRAAADQGFARAQYNLGILNYAGLGRIAQNTKLALELFKAAADKGDADAQLVLGRMHKVGVIGATNHKAAVKLFMSSLKNGVCPHRFRQQLKSILSLKNDYESYYETPIGDIENIAVLRENLENLKDHYLFIIASARSGFNDTLGDNIILRELGEQVLSLCDPYLALIDRLEEPDFMLTCLTFDPRNSYYLDELTTYLDGITYFSFYPQDLSFLNNPQLYKVINQHYAYHSNLVRIIGEILEENLVEYDEDLLVTKARIMANITDKNQKLFYTAYLQHIFSLRGGYKVKEEALSLLHKSLSRQLQRLKRYRNSAQELNKTVIQTIKTSAGNRNQLFIETIWKADPSLL